MRALLLAVVVPLLQGDSLRDAVNLGRTHDRAMYEAFNAGYRLTPSGDVDSAEVITEFRRAVMIVRQHADSGEYSFNENGLAAELAPYRGLVTIVAQVRLNPLNTYVKPPSYDMYVRTGASTKPVAPSAFKREAVYPPGMGPPGSPLIGVRLEATFSRADVATAPEPYVVVTDDRANILWQARFDLSRFR
jgi:hypothetical protein